MSFRRFQSLQVNEDAAALGAQLENTVTEKLDSLSDCVSRAKARWLKRVMYESRATSTQKCLAYAIADYLNCVTLDAWPAQETLALRLGHKSTKTILRSARALEALGLVRIERFTSGKARSRYAPIFHDKEFDSHVRIPRHAGACRPDAGVRESFLTIHTKSSSMKKAAESSTHGLCSSQFFNPKERGAMEVKVAAKIGRDGWDILASLSAIDDAIVERLCGALAEGCLSERDLAAARLAAEQA